MNVLGGTGSVGVEEGAIRLPRADLRVSRFGAPASAEALGLARLAFGAVVFASLVLDMVPHAREFFSDEGFLPRQAMLGLARTTRFSVMDMAASPAMATAFLIAAALAALCFCVGWQTRIATVASFVLVSGIQERNLDVSDGHDNVVRVMLAIFMFIPMGARYSIDALILRASGEPPQEIRWTLPVWLAQIQFAWVYFASFLGKWCGQAWRAGDAVRDALWLGHCGFARPLGIHLVNVRPFTWTLNWVTLAFEACFIFLVFSPVSRRVTRRVAIVAGTFFHIGIYLTMNVGWFPHTMISLYAIYFDDEWARAPARIWAKYRGHAPAVASPFEACVAWLTKATSSSVGSPLPSARSRGALTICRFAAGPILGGLLFIGMWTTVPAAYIRSLTPPPFLVQVVESLELWQNWSMFAPEPPHRDVWIEARGELRDGTAVDVFRGRAGAPIVPRRTLFYSPWIKLRDNMATADSERLLQFGRFLCREWNHAEPQSPSDLVRFTITRLGQSRPFADGTKPPVVGKELWAHECFDPPAPAEGTVSSL